MPTSSQTLANLMAPSFLLDRRHAVPALIGRHQDFLFVAGLAGTSRDIVALTDDGAHVYSMAGAMGGAAMIGLGLALARRDRRVMVLTGDGELLMNLGALATLAVLNPPNLSIPAIKKATPALVSTSRRSRRGRGSQAHHNRGNGGRARRWRPPAPRGQWHGPGVAAGQTDRAAEVQARPRSGPLPGAISHSVACAGVKERSWAQAYANFGHAARS